MTSKCFLNNLGHEETVLSSKESVIILLHGTETVVTIDRFLSVRCEEKGCRLLGEGTVKPFHVNDSGQAAINILNGFHKVKTEPNGEKVFFQTENIQRKVMLYDCGNGAATVIDYMRKLTCYLFKENSKMTFGIGKCLGWIGRNKSLMCTSLLRNTRNLTSLFVRHLVELQEIQLLLIQYLLLQRDTGLVQIAGKKKFDLFSLLFFKHLQITITLFWKIKSRECEKKMSLQLLLTDSEFIDTI